MCQGLFKYKLCPFLQDSGRQQSHPLCNHHTILLSPEAFFGEIILLFVQLSHLPGLTKDLSAVIHSAHAWQEPRCPNFPLSSYFLSLKITLHVCEYLHSSHFSHYPSDVVSLCVWSPSLLAPAITSFLDVKSFQCSVWPLQISEPDRESSSMPAGQLGWWVWDRQSCQNRSLQ